MTHEVASERTRFWLDNQTPGDLVISDWVVTEVSSALAIKLRTGAINLTQRADALAAFDQLIKRVFRRLRLAPEHFAAAARLADQFTLALRAGDALHLAVAMDHAATLCTLDRRLATAAGAIGARVELI